jgi:hypothetical protein
VTLLLVLLAVGLTTFGLLIVLLVALIRHLKLLSGSAHQFGDEVNPLLKGISAGGAVAQDRLAKLSDQGRSLPGRSRRGRSGRGPGARIRS